MSAASPKILRISGLILHILIGALLIFAGSFKLFGTLPKEAVEEMAKSGVGPHLTLIASGELITGILLIVPWTSSLGVLLTSGFWGGVICLHMTHDQSYVAWTIALLLTWVGAFLREPTMFSSFSLHQASTERPIT